MTARLPYLFRRREAERRRVEAFIVAMRATAPEPPPPPAPEPRTAPLPLPRVALIATPRGPMWTLDEASRARLRTDTAELPSVVARASAPLRKA